jgi:formimidoylglutamate deiminase
VPDELRQLEYSQRLLHRQRNVLAPAGGSNGRTLFDDALAGGNRALGGRPSGIAVGSAASFVALDDSHPSIAGKSGDAILDAWIFANGSKAQAVWIGGRKVVSDGRHIHREAIAQRFRKTMIDLAAA